MSARERRRAQTETEIVDAAMQIVADEGMGGLTVGRIAKAIDYSPGALYRYFPSKDAILAELHRRTIGEVEQRMSDRLEQVDATLPLKARALARLVVAAESYRDFSLEHPGPFRLVAMSLAEPRRLVDSEQATVAIPAYLSLFARLSGLFTDALDAGALRSASSAADLTIAFALALQGPLQVEKLKVHAPTPLLDTEALTRLVVDGLLVGWGAPPDQVAAARREADTSCAPAGQGPQAWAGEPA